MNRTCKTPGCLTHPALCKPEYCPDFKRNINIGLMHQSIYHGTRSEAHSHSCDRGRVQENRRTQGTGSELAGLCAPATAWYSREENEEVSKILLTSHEGKQGKGLELQ